MEFHIPFEVKDVECHLTWMEEMVPMLERSLVERSPTMEEHIISIQKVIDEDECDGDLDIVADETYEDSYNDHYPKFCGLYASRLNEAVKLTYLSKFEDARNQLRLLDTLYDRLEPCHRTAFQYAVDASKWANTLLENLKKVEEGRDEEQQAIEDPITFQLRMDKLQEDDKSKACLKYMWGCLGGNLKIAEERVLVIFQEVIGLDPDYHIWYAEVYRKLRGIRRNSRRHEAGRLLKPSKEEQQMCQEAYNRAPSIYLNIKNLAMLLKETLWNEGQEYWEEHEQVYLQCIELFYEALEIARLRQQGKWMKKISMYLAEFLLFGRGRKLDQDEGKQLFDQCLEDNPKDSAVLHKVGKLCHLGANTTKKFKNLDMAERFYACALEAKSTNYPCLKDYLRLLSSRKKYAEYVETIDWVIGDMKRDFQVSDLKILRGCALWIFNPFQDKDNRDQAIEDWLYVEIKLPEYAKNLYTSVKKPPFYLDRNVPAYINRKQLITALETFKSKKCGNNKEKLNATQRILEEVKRMEQQEPSHKPFNLSERPRVPFQRNKQHNSVK